MKPRFSSHRQGGAALIVVLILMVMATMFAVTGLQGGVTNEKLAGNYRAAALAQMAAEVGASKWVSSSNIEAGGGVCGAEALNASEADWVSVNNKGDASVWYKMVPCEYESVKGKAVFVRGRVSSGNHDIAVRDIIVARPAGLPKKGLPGDIFDYALLSAGPYSYNPASRVSGDEKMNAGLVNVPDPRAKHSSDPSRNGYIDYVKKMMGEGGDVVESCGDGLGSVAATYIYCAGTFVGDIDEKIDGKILVAEGGIGNGKGSNVKASVSAYLVSGGEINLKGFGDNVIKGLLWAAGSVSIKGRSNFQGSVVSNGAIDFNGKVFIDKASDNLEGSGATDSLVWKSL